MMRWREQAPLAVLVAAVLVLFHRLLLGEVIFWGTPLLQFYPWESMAFDLARSGRLPLWNPLLGFGAPLLANYQTAFFYPPNWLYLIIPVEYGMGFLGLAHVIWAGLGMIAYLRRLKIGLLGQGMGAIAFSLSGYLVSRFGFLSITFAVSWLPWLMWAVEGCALPPAGNISRRDVTLLALICAMQLLAGHAQTTFYSFVLAGGYSLWRTLRSKFLPQAQKTKTLALIAAGVAAGALLAAVQLIPTAELMFVSQRAGGVERETGLTYSFWPWRLLTLIAPNLFGSPATGNYDGYAAYWEDAIYVGLLTLVMAGHGVARWIRERRANELSLAADAVPFFVAILPVVLVLALGKNTPVFTWLFDHGVPGFSTFQAPSRWMLLAVFGLCVLAAIGADAWRTSARGVFWTRLLTAGGASFVIAAYMAVRFANDFVRSSFVPSMFWLGGTIIVVGALSLLLPLVEEHPRWRPWWEGCVLLVIAADLVVSNWGLNPTISPDYYHQAAKLAQVVRPNTQGFRTVILDTDEHALTIDTYLDFKDFHPLDRAHWDALRGSLLPNLGTLDGIPSANNFDPLLVGQQNELLKSLDSKSDPEIVRQLQQMNVGVWLSNRPHAGLEELAQSDAVYAYRIPDAWPRAVVADCMAQGGSLTCTNTGTGRAEIVSDTDTQVTVSVESGVPAMLLLIDTYYPGWQATVDGVPAAIERANVAFRAVRIVSGSHTVIFRYEPESVRWGAVISGMSVVALMLVSLGGRVRWFRRR